MGAIRAHSASEIHSSYIVYCVVNGPNILAIGEGRAERLKGLMPGSSCRKHVKSFIVAASQTVFRSSNEFYFISVPSKHAGAEIESQLHAKFGKVHIVLLGSRSSVAEISRWLWQQLKRSTPDVHDRVDAVMTAVCQDGDALVSLLKTEEFGPALDKILRGYYKSPQAAQAAAKAG